MPEEILGTVMKPVEVVTAVKFQVKKTLVLADPCYIDEDDGTRKKILSDIAKREAGAGSLSKAWATEGEWIAEIEMLDNSQTHGWGDRVATLKARRTDIPMQYDPTRRSTRIFAGRNGVDSGQMFIGCASGLPLNYEDLLAVYGPPGDHDKWVMKDFFAFASGAVSSTGCGDGLYEVWAWADKDDLITGVEIIFLSDEEDSLYDDEDEDC